MVEEEQGTASADPERPVSQADQGMQLITELAEALKQLGEGQATIMRGMNQNANRIQALETRPDKPLIPKEIAKMIPDLIKGLTEALFAPDKTPDAKQGSLFTEKLADAYEKSMLKQLEVNALSAEANLNRVLLENKRIQKQLEGEF